MAKIPFPLGLKGSEDLPRGRQTLLNCFNNQAGQILGLPGITKRSTTPGNARGGFEFNGGLYGVTGNSLIKITDVLTGAHTVIGAIAGSENIRWATDFSGAAIVVQGGAIYTLSNSDVLVDISGNANFVPCVDVAVIDGIFVYIPADGDPAFFSDVGAAGTVQATSFFDAESLPDKNNAVFNLRNTLYIAGTNSVEPFRNVGTAINPFARIQGARLDNGFIGGLLEYGNTFIYIGNPKDQDVGVYAISPGAATKLSNETIDIALKKYTPDQLAEAVSNRIIWNGYDLATINLRDDSFGFYKGEWFELDTVFDGISRPWGAGFVTQFNLKYYSFFQDNFGVFEKVNTVYGNRITRVIDFGIDHPNGERFSCQSIELGISQGFNAAVGSVALFMSKDNVNYPIPLYRNLGSIGEYADNLVWNPPGGLGNYNKFMGTRIYTTEDVEFSSDYLIVNIQ